MLTHAAEEADRLNHPHVGTEHLFLGLLREEAGLAANLLRERGQTSYANVGRQRGPCYSTVPIYRDSFARSPFW